MRYSFVLQSWIINKDISFLFSRNQRSCTWLLRILGRVHSMASRSLGGSTTNSVVQSSMGITTRRRKRVERTVARQDRQLGWTWRLLDCARGKYPKAYFDGPVGQVILKDIFICILTYTYLSKTCETEICCYLADKSNKAKDKQVVKLVFDFINLLYCYRL